MNRKTPLDRKLSEAGWTRRFVAGEPRLSEAVLAYQEAGFETRLEPLTKTDCEICRDDGKNNDCRICFEGHEDEYKVIFTRPKGGT